MRKVDSLSGQELRDMFMVATDWLEKNASEVDALNVFPVPDGDTGTNMLLTMRSTLEEAYRAPDHSTTAIARAIAHSPRVVYADEPTAELDTVTGVHIVAIFRRLIEEEGITVVMTTHDPAMQELADHVIELENGSVVTES